MKKLAMTKLKVAIAGCGRISVSYADAFHKLSDEIDVVYAIDKVPEKARKFAAQFGCSYGTNIAEIYGKGIDVVHLCLPHEQEEYEEKKKAAA